MPNPVTDDSAKLLYRLSAPAARLRIRVITSSSRRIRDVEFRPDTCGCLGQQPLEGVDALGGRLANGTYHYLVEIYDEGDSANNWVPVDRRAGTFFVLR